MTPTSNIGGDYQTYTTRYQSSEDANVTADNKAGAEACYPQNQIANASTVWTPVYAYPSVFADQTPNPPPYILSNYSSLLSNCSLDYATLESNAQAPPSYIPNNPNWYLIGDEVASSNGSYFGCIWPVPPNLPNAGPPNTQYWSPTSTKLEFYFRFDYHPPVPSEIREETWNCLTWGAKGNYI